MANRVFQSVIYQMKDAIDRVVGVVDETGCDLLPELNPDWKEGWALWQSA